MTYDYRYRCVGCKKEFTLHSEEALDPLEYDPACPWCEDTTGLPCYVAKLDDGFTTALMAEAQATLMGELASRNGADKGGN